MASWEIFINFLHKVFLHKFFENDVKQIKIHREKSISQDSKDSAPKFQTTKIEIYSYYMFQKKKILSFGLCQFLLVKLLSIYSGSTSDDIFSPVQSGPSVGIHREPIYVYFNSKDRPLSKDDYGLRLRSLHSRDWLLLPDRLLSRDRLLSHGRILFVFCEVVAQNTC